MKRSVAHVYLQQKGQLPPPLCGRIGVGVWFDPHDDSVYVRQGRLIERWTIYSAIACHSDAKQCCESRQVNYPAGSEHCPCLACNVSKAVYREVARRTLEELGTAAKASDEEGQA